MRKKNTIKTALGIVFAILILSSCMTFVKAATATNNDFNFDLEEMKATVQSSPDECWRKPAQNRKNTICNKIDELQQLIDEQNFEEAYDKLLYDIKPKLTALKTDENEEPRGNGVFEQVWVTCENLREEFRVACNLILAEINPQSVYDDDKTPPDISIIYEGGKIVSNPGVWHVDIEDLESGLDEVIIEVNGIVEIHDTNLLGILSLSYDIPVPAIVGINTIVVTATNNDKDFVGDQETSTEIKWVEIKEITPPIITIGYVGGNLDSDPGVWNVIVEDSEEGIIYVKISIDTILYIEELLGGVPSVSYPNIPVPSVADDHVIEVTARNSDNYQSEDSNLVSIADDDTTGPMITVYYIGSGTEIDPGWWDVYISDSESGIDAVRILINGYKWVYDQNLEGIPSTNYLDIIVPGSLGTHKLEVWAWNYDGEWEDDQESSYYMTTQTIIEDPLMDDDTSPPTITIVYQGEYTVDDPGVWEVTVGDAQSGLDTVTILVDGGQWIQESLGGMKTKMYSVPVPVVEGFHTVEVTAVNNDNDRPNDQQSKTESHTIEIIDDDTTGPMISVIYYGSGNDYNPGWWIVDIQDFESGIDEVLILINGYEFLYHPNLDGVQSVSYPQVFVPPTVIVHWLKVIALNNDKDWEGDQERSVLLDFVEIVPDGPGSPQPNIYPTISIDYIGDGTEQNPGVWSVSLEDINVGIDEVQIKIDGSIYLYEEDLGGINSITYSDIPVPATAGIHKIEVGAIISNGRSNSESNIVEIIDDDTTGPIITVIYIGSGTDFDPGWWDVHVKDLESSIDAVRILINGFTWLYDQNLGGVQSIYYTGNPTPFPGEPEGNGVPCPSTIATHTLEVWAWNYDTDYEGDQESSYYMTTQIIVHDPDPPPLP